LTNTYILFPRMPSQFLGSCILSISCLWKRCWQW